MKQSTRANKRKLPPTCEKDHKQCLTEGLCLQGVSSGSLRSCNSLGSVAFLTEDGEAAGVEALRLGLLFLPTKTRIWLQTLLRFMARVSANVHLRSSLDLHRYRVLELFTWALLPEAALPISQVL